MKKALIMVDLQNDFLPGGTLAVPEGDAVIPVANSIINNFNDVIATQDWHPSNHGSFASQYSGKEPGQQIELNGLTQILWPDHCVEKSKGAEFAPGLNTEKITRVFRKGMDKTVDSYSGFFDNGQLRDTGLGEYLRSLEITDVFIMGLATDYCVKFTALDALNLGFNTHLLKEGIRGVDINKGDSDNAIADMKAAGIKIVETFSP